MNALTKKDKLALQVSLTLVAGMFSLVPVAQGAPVLEKVVSGGADVTPGTNTTITSKNLNNVINWRDFSIADNESVTFDNGAKTNNYLNVVTGNGTSYINGAMSGGKDVYLVNPNGVIMGEQAQIDVGNLYVSTRDLTGDLANIIDGETVWKGESVLDPSKVQSEVVNMGKITANSVYAEGTSITFLNTADINVDTNDSGNSKVTLNGKDYVHVGYQAIATNSQDYSSLESTVGTPATELGYNINNNGGQKYHDANGKYDGVNPYDFAWVENKNQLQGMNTNKSINYMLTNNIENVGDFTPIGTYNEEGDDPYKDAFTGNFDGNYHTISGLVINDDYAGLFGYVQGGYEKTVNEQGKTVLGSRLASNRIMNLGIINPQVTAKVYGGALSGAVDNTKVENVYVKNTYSNKVNPSLVRAATSDNSFPANDVSVGDGTAKNYVSPPIAKAVGGLIGQATNGSYIQSVYNDGTVMNGAGIVGELSNKSTIKNSYNSGLITSVYDYKKVLNEQGQPVIHEGFYDVDFVEHYGIADQVDGSSTIENVYNSGAYEAVKISTQELSNSKGLVPAGVPVTKGYVISQYEPTYGYDTQALTMVMTLGKLDSLKIESGSTGSATSAKSYAFFPSGKSKDDDGIWRIYEGHSLPLLRSFLKANGKGTVPVGYNLALYANATPNTVGNVTTYSADGYATMRLKGSSADGKITYNGYYIGGADVEMDSSRGLDSGKVYSNTTSLIKNVDETNIFFYSVDQDGYDLATEALTVAARPLANPAGIKNVDKVYDGTTTASTALANQFGKTINLLDYKIDPNDNSAAPLVEDPGYGIVEVYAAGAAANADPYHIDDVALNPEFIDTANTIYNTSDATVQEVEGDNRTHPNNATITVKTVTGKASLKGADIGNYSLTKDDVEKVSVTGDITLRPVKIGLHKDENINKVYDKSSQVVYVGTSDDGWTPNVGNTITAKDNVYQDVEDGTGLVGESVDSVTLLVDTPYYSKNGVAIINAGDNYKANYKFVLNGDSAKNYQVQDLSGTAMSLVDDTDSTVAGAKVYWLKGDGAITKRNITLNSISFSNKDGELVEGTYLDVNNQKHQVHGTKVYDYSTTYLYDEKDDSTAKFAKNVYFDTANTITEAAALEHDPDHEDGVIDTDVTALKNALMLKDAKFTGNTVDADAITYSVGAKAGTNIWDNYTLDNSDVSETTSKDITRTGSITHRIITVGMRKSDEIDMVYNADKVVVDIDNKGYLNFKGTAAEGAHDSGYVTYADGATKLVADSSTRNDGVGWKISGEYQEVPASQTANNLKVDAQDVYLDADGNPAAKGIIYSVGLYGGNAKNYKVKTADMTDSAAKTMVADGTETVSLNATGTIDQLELTPEFATITKQYDGTVYVLPQVNVTFSDGSKGTLTPQETNGTTAKEQINITLPGLLDADKGKVKVDTSSADFSAVYNDANASKIIDTDTGAYDESRAYRVDYSGLKLASVDNSSKINNYKMGSTGSGNGVITKLTLTENNLTPGYVDTGISKTYDAKKELDNAKNFVTGLGVSGVVATVAGSNLPSVDLDATTAEYKDKNRGGTDDHEVTFSYKLTASDNYEFEESTNLSHVGTDAEGVYTFKDTVEGKLLVRNVTATAVKNLTKTYDAMTAYTDGNRNVYKDDAGDVDGARVVTLSDGTENNSIFALDGTKNISTAEYDNANVNVDANTAKKVTYTPKIKTDDETNYKIVDENGNDVVAPLTDISGTINKRDLTLTFNPLTKTFDNSPALTEANVGNIGITLDAGTNGAAVIGAVADGGDGTQAALDVTKLDKDYAYGLLDNSSFTPDKNAGTKVIQYNGVDEDVLGGAIGNYNLYYKIGTNEKVAIENGTGYGAGTIGKKHLTDADIVTNFKHVTKEYDAEDGVGYTHYSSDGYVLKDDDGNPLDSVTVTANSFVDSITIDGTAVEYIADPDAEGYSGGYSIDSATYGSGVTNATFSASSNAGEQTDEPGSKSAVFKFKIGDDWTKNLDFEDVSSFDPGTNILTRYTSKDNGQASITAKTIYASLTDQYTAPTKVYDGTKNVTQGSSQTSTGTAISATDLHDYVNVSGLMGNDGYTVSAKYNSENVADKDATLGNTVNYTVDLGNAAGNYKLYVKNAEGVIVDANGTETTAANSVVRGAGTITPKDLVFKAGYAEKVYDDNAKVNVTGAANAPDYELTGFVGTQKLTLKAADVVGTYVVKATDDDGNFLYHDKDGNPVYDYVYNDDNGNPVAHYKIDKHVGEVDPVNNNPISDYRAVQYSNLKQALANADADNGAIASNYVISEAVVKADNENNNAPNKTHVGEAATYFDAEAGMAVYGSDLQNGKITKRAIDTITPTFYDIEREYNASYYVGDSIDDDKAREYFKLEGTAQGMDGTVSVDYNLLEAVFADPTGTPTDIVGSNAQRVDGYDPTNTYEDVNDTGFKAVYKINGLSMETQRDFELGSLGSDNYVGYFASTNTTNNITPRVISGKVVEGAYQDKVYNGETTAEKVGKDQFVYDEDDLKILRKNLGLQEGADLGQYLTVDGNYAVWSDTDSKYLPDANFSMAPEEVDSTHKRLKDIAFTMKWAEDQDDTAYQSNYVFDDKNGGWTDGTNTEYVGKGDIRQRIVYVQDTGGDTIEKTYDGTATADAATRNGKFNLIADNTATSGIITLNNVPDDVSLAGGITAQYVKSDGNGGYESDSNVERDSSGNVLNKAVKFTGFALAGDAKDNYFLMTKENADGGDIAYNNDASATNDGMYIVESSGGKIKPKAITVNVNNSAEKVYDATDKVADTYAAADNLKAAADVKSIATEYSSVNSDINNRMKLTIVASNEADANNPDIVNVTITSRPTYDDVNAHKENDEVVGDKVTTYNLSWDNGNYDLIGQFDDHGGTQAPVAGQAEDTFVATGYKKNNDGSVTRTGELKDYQGKISPRKLKINSMEGTKTYNGYTDFSYDYADSSSSNTLNVGLGDEETNLEVPLADVFSNEGVDMSDPKSINKLLKVTATGTYEGAADGVKAEAKNQDDSITDEDLAETRAQDAAFNATSDPNLYVHTVKYDSVAIANNNYELVDVVDDTNPYEGTGIINRAKVKAISSSATITEGEAMPSFSGDFDGFLAVDAIPIYEEDGVTPKLDEDNNPITIPLSEYYNNPDSFRWGPETNVTNKSVGTNPVYGWYRKDTADGHGWSRETGFNFDRNYTLAEQVVGSFVVKAAPKPVPVIPEPEKPAVLPFEEVDTGYVDKPVVPDNKVYQSVSKDENKSHNHEPKAAIQYGNTGTGIVADRDEGGSSGTIAIELAEVVNLLGGEVASDGTMSLANQERKSSLSVGSTSEGFLSVGNGDNEASGQTDLFSEGEIAIENKDGEIGLENEENLWQGQAELAMAEGSILSDGQIVNEEDEKDKDKKKKTLEEKNEHEASATITYGDVA